MKKTLLILSALAASMAANAELNLYMGSQELVASQQYWFNDMTVNDEGNYVEMKIDPKLSVRADKLTFDVQVTAECTSGQQIQMCCGGACEKNTKVVKSGLKVDANGSLNLDFEFTGEFDNASQIPEGITTDITIEELGVPESKKTYTLILNDKQGGMEIVAADNNVTFSGKTLNYNVSGPSSLTICACDGSAALSTEINGNGSVDLSNMQRGIYIYRIAGSADAAGKVYIK